MFRNAVEHDLGSYEMITKENILVMARRLWEKEGNNVQNLIKTLIHYKHIMAWQEDKIHQKYMQ